IAAVHRSSGPLRFGRMYYREISGDARTFALPWEGLAYTLAFSRVLYGQEVLVAYNVSGTPRQDFVIVDANLHAARAPMTRLYGSGAAPATLDVQGSGEGPAYVQLPLGGHEFAIYA
ncbi:MAG TPA: hypothetical protein VKU80_16395, partial [Planctomycetota bacterium]|nr:hypothetical protein [Planctomycetota bacterium]